MSLDVEYEWADVAESPDETVHRTMAKLQISVNGHLVTAVKDYQHKLDREYVLVPLHHVAEWLVSNWHHLLYEAENSNEPQRPGFESRHNLAFAGDGFILPPLTIAPTDGATVMRWATSKPKFSEIEFTRYGEERIPTDEMESACSSLIEAVLGKRRQENLSLETLEEASIGAFLSASVSGPSLLSTIATDFQAFTRAFAAEFLAPAEQLRARMKGGRTSVAALAREFRVSKFVIAHQVQNHHLGYVTKD